MLNASVVIAHCSSAYLNVHDEVTAYSQPLGTLPGFIEVKLAARRACFGATRSTKVDEQVYGRCVFAGIGVNFGHDLPGIL